MNKYIKMTDFLNRVNLQELYTDKYSDSVIKARNMLTKCPPDKFTSVWPILSDEAFRSKENLTDNDAVVVLSLAFAIIKESPNIVLYWCDSWEIFYENLMLFDRFSPKINQPSELSQPIQVKSHVTNSIDIDPHLKIKII